GASELVFQPPYQPPESIIVDGGDVSNLELFIGFPGNTDHARRGGARLQIDPIHPNPARHSVDVTFSLDRPAGATIDVYDVLGRRVLTETSDVFLPGDHRVPLDVSGLATGVYFVRVAAGAVSGSARFVIVR
ncbi:MAG: T9SS type A sorting domain-containing protein, partial [Rhodothermales bacterium]|nr:T9SS type A sorting domain-containing protein [Rhodothermales bacterium]